MSDTGTDADGADALVRVPNAEANAGATDFAHQFDDDAVATVYTFDGREWQPVRLEPGDATTVRLPTGQPAAKIVVDPDEGEGEGDEKIS